MTRRKPASAAVALMLVVGACSSDDASTSEPAAITLVTYDSFPDAETSMNEALQAFSSETGIAVEILVAGDTGTMLSKAALTVGNPEGDVMWGIDNTFLSRALNEGIFEPAAMPVGAETPSRVHSALPRRTGRTCRLRRCVHQLRPGLVR